MSASSAAASESTGAGRPATGDTGSEPPLLAACRGRAPSRNPVWFMRQAGRSLPEYRAAREGVPMLEACMRPELIAELTLQPVRRYGVDAAILFSDIVLPLAAIGVGVELVAGVGPVIEQPIRSRRDLNRLRPLEPGEVSYVSEAIHTLVSELGGTPLIGFAGAPFTLASYLIEGGPSRNHTMTKALMYSGDSLWRDLLDKLADLALSFLRVQISAGAGAVQLFDSWVGTISEPDYRRSVLPASRGVLAGLADLPVPRIHFGVGTGELLAAMADAGAEVVGVDWRTPLDVAARRLPAGVAVQGNLDPAVLQAPWPVIANRVRRTLQAGAAASGHIFNLGHGVPPETSPEVLARVVDLVHSEPVAALAAGGSW